MHRVAPNTLNLILMDRDRSGLTNSNFFSFNSFRLATRARYFNFRNYKLTVESMASPSSFTPLKKAMSFL